MATGTGLLDFGPFPGATDAQLAVVGQAAILAASLVEAWVMPAATVDHSVDEHIADPPRVVAGPPVAGVGFTIYGFQQPSWEAGSPDNARPYGKWNIAWAWA